MPGSAPQSDVQQALIKTLGGIQGRGNEDSPYEDRARLMMMGEFGGATSQRGMGDSSCPSCNDFSTVRGGLQAILTSFQMDATSDGECQGYVYFNKHLHWQ